MQDKPVTLAAITGAHGVTGEVRLKLFGEGIDSLRDLGSFNDGELTLKTIRSDNKGGGVARFNDVASREQAEALRGTELTVSRADLPALAEGEFYHADLLGLTVVTDAGQTAGRVSSVENFGATDIVEITKDPVPEKGMKSFMVPLTPQAVLRWDAEKLVIAADFADN